MSKREIRPFHIVIEGIDGCGKGTQVRRLCDWLCQRGRKPHVVNDPGASGAGAAPSIRRILLDKNVPMTPEQQLLLYTAARIDARNATARLLREGCDVIGDRWVMSTFVYQGMVYGSGVQLVAELHNQFVKMMPDVTILLDLPAHVAQHRLLMADTKEGDPVPSMDRHESQGVTFAESLRKGYRLCAEDDPNAWIVDAEQSEEDVFADILEACKLKVDGFEEICGDEHVQPAPAAGATESTNDAHSGT